MDFIAAYQFERKNRSDFLTDKTFRKHWLEMYHSRKTHVFWSQELPRFSSFLRNLNIYLVFGGDGSAAKDKDPANEPVVFTAVLAGMVKERKTKGDDSILSEKFLKYLELSMASEMLDHLAAGHETSGIMLTYISWYLSQDLGIQDRLRAELLTLSPNMSLLSTRPDILIPNNLDSLPLLHAILIKTLRTNSAIPGNQPRVTPHSKFTTGKLLIPDGIRVGAHGYSVHRNVQIYLGPEKWAYTRWLDDENSYTEE